MMVVQKFVVNLQFLRTLIFDYYFMLGLSKTVNNFQQKDNFCFTFRKQNFLSLESVFTFTTMKRKLNKFNEYNSTINILHKGRNVYQTNPAHDGSIPTPHLLSYVQ